MAEIMKVLLFSTKRERVVSGKGKRHAREESLAGRDEVWCAAWACAVAPAQNLQSLLETFICLNQRRQCSSRGRAARPGQGMDSKAQAQAARPGT